MPLFRTTLIAMTAVIIAMTLAAVAREGLDLVTPFFSPIVALSWQGQFNIDFACYLALSGLWMAWRGGFTGGAIALGVLAPALGMVFLAPYLLYLVRQSGGEARRLLLGVHA